MGGETQIIYKTSLDNEVYTHIPYYNFPVRSCNYPIMLASQVNTSNGLGGDYIKKYEYQGAILHLWGKGFLGFRKTIERDLQAGTANVVEFELNDEIFLNRPKKITTKLLSDDKIIDYTINELDTILIRTGSQSNLIRCYFPFISSSIENKFDLSSADAYMTQKCVINKADFDNYFNGSS